MFTLRMARPKKQLPFDHVARLERAIEAATKFIEDPTNADGQSLASMVSAVTNLAAVYSAQKRLPSQMDVDHLSAGLRLVEGRLRDLSVAFEKHKAAQPSGLATRLGR
jgi:hypothetical protein